ncbi:alpha-mannosidase [Klebsormidium nitens]|uniref:alpha-1,2-Mannosidase n=1 Tax=Klebsormidium nitens TaxID=105231 RepID=A0A1Y1I864_KLENI|nr:alpha-mannosidase [Klebsormidium nitens]|eukprot:GAQ84298.1 alpha-mannosidase [Klebsormidium nitens]
MGRKPSHSSSSRRSWRSYIHPAYYLRKPRRLAVVTIIFVLSIYVVMDHHSQRTEIQHLQKKLRALEVEKLNALDMNVGGTPSDVMVEMGKVDKLVKSKPAEPVSPWGKTVGSDDDALDPDTKKKRDEIREAMEHSWSAYEKYAWGFDELQPQSKRGVNQFGGLGATIVDSLDTLFIMGLKPQFEKAKEWVKTSMNFDVNYDASVFETTIRCVGGLLSAYDLSGDSMFLNKATDLADRLLPAFNTPTGIPYNTINLQSGQAYNPGWTGQASTLADFGTEQMEFIGLSERTGDQKYRQKVEKTIDVVEENFPEDGLVPLYHDPNTGHATMDKVSFGAMGDSFYEYLLKVWVQSGRAPSMQRYKTMWDRSIGTMLSELIQKSTPSKYVYVAEKQGGALIHKMDHLACFLGGMLVLGSDGNPRADEFLEVAKGIGRTCYEFYQSQPSKLSGEHYYFYEGRDLQVGHAYNIGRPETVETLFYLWRKTKDPIYREWGWNIFQAFQRQCRTPSGYTGLQDVSRDPPQQDDMMQSFFLAETLKYLYLLFSPDDIMSLDKWVFNTEAHPLKIKFSKVEDSSEEASLGRKGGQKGTSLRGDVVA